MLPNSTRKHYKWLVVEKLLLAQHFPFLHAHIKGEKLTCRGSMRPTAHSNTYRVEVCYRPWIAPKVKVLDPTLQFEPEAHMYRDGTLCLFDWRQQPWQANWRLHETVIPWTAEWLIYYELWRLTGKWLGRAAQHGVNPQDAPSADRHTSSAEVADER